MRALSAAELLDAWDQGYNRSPIEQAMILLATAYPDRSLDELADLPIGRRDALLLALRERAFGGSLSGIAHCPRCGEVLDLTFEASEIQVPMPDHADGPPDALLEIAIEGYLVSFRLPTSRDLATVSQTRDAVTAHRHLLERCVLAAQQNGAEIPAGTLPTSVTDALVARMAEADPQADIRLALTCPACTHEWVVIFDIVSFFWKEIGNWVNRMLREVHVLAAAHGWREAEILNMSPWRRRRYLELIEQ